MKNSTVINLVIFVSWTFLLSAQNRVTFKLSDAPKGSLVSIRGNAAPLSWDNSIPLVRDDKDNYFVELEFAEGVSALEYKYILEVGTSVNWENINNRVFHFDKNLLEDSWNLEPLLDISSFPKLSPKQLQEDLEILKAIVQIHPGYGRHLPSDSVDRIIDKISDEFKNPKSLAECYRDLSYISAALQCDHTKLGLNNQGARINSIIHRQADKLPFSFYWINQKMILRKDGSNFDLPRGTEILSINGIKVSEILKSLMPLVAADGKTDQNRIFKLEVNAYDFRYNYFDVFFPLMYPLDETVELTFRKPGSEKNEKAKVTLLTREDRNKIFIEKHPDFPTSRDDLWKYTLEKERSLAVLTINSYGLMGWKAMTIDYKTFLSDFFGLIQEENIKNLVIDIRENTGGMDEMKQELFSYLEFDRKKYKDLKREFKSRYIEYPDILKPHTTTWGNSQEPGFYRLRPDEVRGEYEFVFKERDLRRVKAKRNRFAGQIFLLTSEANTSLAYYTAADFKLSQIGRIIGRETGGNVQGISGGQLAFVTLPNSGILIESSLIGEYSLSEVKNAGVEPDIAIEKSIKAVINNSDLEMEKVYEIIEKGMSVKK